jgi:large conductance mechanosensitive channel
MQIANIHRWDYGLTFIQEFVFFLKTFGVIGLAIAFVIGQAANGLVTAFVKDIIDPQS